MIGGVGILFAFYPTEQQLLAQMETVGEWKRENESVFSQYLAKRA